MAISQQLRHALRNSFSSAGRKEVTAKLNSGVFIGACSVQLRTDLWGLFMPQVAREMIALLSGGGTSNPSQPLRTALSAEFGAQQSYEFLVLVTPEESSSSGDDSSSSSGADSSSSSSGADSSSSSSGVDSSSSSGV